MPGVTLDAGGMIALDRNDRRVVWTEITAAGLDLLRAMDPVIERAPGEILGHMVPADLAELNRLLVLARSRAGDVPECTGTGTQPSESPGNS